MYSVKRLRAALAWPGYRPVSTLHASEKTMLTTQENTINGMTAQAYTAVSRLSVNVYQVQAALANKGAGQN